MQAPDPAEDPTFLPSYNELLRLAEAFCQGHERLAPVEDMLDRVEFDLEQMLHYFDHEVRFQPPGPLVDEVAPEISGGFEFLRTAVADLRRALAAGSLDYFQEQLQGSVRQRMNRLFEALSRLRQAEQEREPLSPSPAVDLFLRAGKGYLQGNLSADLFLERVQSLVTYQQDFMGALETVQPAARERDVLREHEATVESALDFQLEALLELEGQLLQDEPDPCLIEDHLEIVRGSTEKLFEIQQRLSGAAEEQPGKLCFRCGASNDASARFCSQCSAVFPSFALEEEPELSLSIDEQGEPQEERWPENFRRLLEVVEGALTYQVDSEELRQEWQTACARTEAVRRQLTAMPAEAPVREVRRRLDEALSRLEQALERIGEYLESEEPALLQTALNELLPSAELVMQASSLAQAAIREEGFRTGSR